MADLPWIGTTLFAKVIADNKSHRERFNAQFDVNDQYIAYKNVRAYLPLPWSIPCESEILDMIPNILIES